jgi:hypothetical protein
MDKFLGAHRIYFAAFGEEHAASTMPDIMLFS